MSWKPYQQGRRDCRDQIVVPPNTNTSDERLQWEQGWRDQLRNEVHSDAPPIEQDE